MIDYREVKDKLKTSLFDNINYNELLNNLLYRFEYTIPCVDELDARYLELFLLTEGDCAFWNCDGNWVFTSCNRIGNIDEYGRGKDLFCCTENGKQETFKNFKTNPKVVYIRNNKLATPDNLTEKDAQSITEILKSIDCAVVNTRYTEVLAVSNEQVKHQLETAWNKSQTGEPVCVTSNNILNDDGDGLNVHTLHDVRNTDVIQYLHRAYDDILRRYWNRNGLEVCTSTKLAQQTADEVNSGHNARLVSTLGMLEERKKAMEKISAMTGTECSVRLSELWKREKDETEPETEPENEPENELETDKGDNDNENE